MMTANLLILATIGFVQLLAVMSPGPSFLITARTAIVRSRADGIKVALGLGAGSVVWSAAALLGLNRDQIRYRIEKFGLDKPTPA